MTTETDELARICANCNAGYPSEPYGSEFAICLNDPELEPFLDDILERQDFSSCQDFVRCRRFDWEREACEDFDPVGECIDLTDSPELVSEIERLADAGELTAERLQMAIAMDAFNRTDWAQRPVDDDLRQLREVKTLARRTKVLRRLGFLVNSGNQGAFDGICRYVRELGPASTLDDTHLRVEILEQLRCPARDDWDKELAEVLVDDLLRTPSNNTTRGWYTAVFSFLESYCDPEVAEDAMERMLESGKFSYRIEQRINRFLDRHLDADMFL